MHCIRADPILPLSIKECIIKESLVAVIDNTCKGIDAACRGYKLSLRVFRCVLQENDPHEVICAVSFVRIDRNCKRRSCCVDAVHIGVANVGEELFLRIIFQVWMHDHLVNSECTVHCKDHNQ